ncbi:MAG: cyclic peptide export ABC transporter [Flammeovirgaceae bacterium]
MRIIQLIFQTSWSKFLSSTLLSVISGITYTFFAKYLHEATTGVLELNQGMVMNILMLLLISTVAAIGSIYFLSTLSEEIIHNFRMTISSKVLRSNFEEVERKGGDIVPILTEEVNVIGRFVKQTPEFFTAITKMIGCMLYLFWVSWRFSLIISVSFVVILILILTLIPYVRKHEKILQDNRFFIFLYIRGLIAGLRELSLNSKHKKTYVNDIIDPIGKKQVFHQMMLTVFHASTIKVGELVSGAILLIALLLGAQYDLFNGANFQDFLIIILFLLPSLVCIVNVTQKFQLVDVTLKRIDALQLSDDLGVQPLEENHIDATTIFVSLENVSYSYYHKDKLTFSLENINLQIHKNEVLFIIGGNGSGKTSLCKLICGLYQPKKGQILYKGNIPIHARNLNSYREFFTAIFSDSYVFDNLTYIEDDYFEKYAAKYVKLLALEHKVNLDNKVIDTIELSLGQRGRLSMLRALLENRDVYVFDEWAANQDFQFREVFYREIIPLLKSQGKIVVLISHDERYFDCADRLVKLENGQLVTYHSVIE